MLTSVPSPTKQLDDKSGCPTFYMSTRDDALRSTLGRYGFLRVDSIKKADFIVFGGGSDINPLLYGEYRHQYTTPSITRDLDDINTLRQSVRYSQGFIGVCRGGQFLNVMVGNGKMYQHVDGHSLGEDGHMAEDKKHNLFRVNSFHHQMMIPGSDADVLLCGNAATAKYTYDSFVNVDKPVFDDPEVVYYPSEQALCFQPHPEYNSKTDTQELFFSFIETQMLTTKMSERMLAYRLNTFGEN